MFHLEKKTASRKFIDLIKTAVSKLANWEPSIPIEAGDYGTLDRETGQFERQGNIYKEVEIKSITSRFPPIIGPQIDMYQVASLTVKKLDVKYAAKSSGNSPSEIMFSGKWQFGRARGALLLMHHSRITRLPDELLQELKLSSWVKGKFIVTHIHTCPAYALYLSAKNSEIVDISLHAFGSSASPSASTTGVGVGAYWVADGVPGTFQRAAAPEPVFVPLYQVKELRKHTETRREGHNLVVKEEEAWEPIEVPWNFLDEDGKEGPEDPEEHSSEYESDKQE
ncbi:hypothetical protein A7U60_g7780 [Sanghuangporus baumii]|uniref:Uncharacterized protein n=1 Tax=Sanghuangporus baumii TaxID=108892 RepID=A0A9Q5HSP5_SANBA|nr:hypothetical protein A7U60_g7780 [Sanghuangporus baumii]